MKFDCNELSISDDQLGLTITLSEMKDDPVAEMSMTDKELMNLPGEYLLIQKTYAEDEFEKDFYSVETSDPEKSGELTSFTINLYRHQFLIAWDDELFEIKMNIDNREFEALKAALKKLTISSGHLVIHD